MTTLTIPGCCCLTVTQLGLTCDMGYWEYWGLATCPLADAVECGAGGGAMLCSARGEGAGWDSWW